MYIPASFAETDPARAHALIAANPFGALVVPTGDGGVEIAHVPFLLEREPGAGALRVHVARQNPIGALAGGKRVVAMFQGAHTYVSPRWYESPTRNVPTWNFLAVHAHGVATRIDDRAEVLRALADLTAQHEAGTRAPWSIGEADAAYVEGLAGGIVLFSIAIERLEMKAKLSQNRTAGDRRRVVEALRARGGPGDAAVAEEMEAREGRG